MKIIEAGVLLDKLIEDFARRFPKLATKGGSFGKCKFLSYELALFLRRRGVKAKITHVQGLAQKKWKTTAHATWAAKPSHLWSHYVVIVGGIAVDLTARQFGSQLEFPRVVKRSVLATEWDSVEPDNFLNKLVSEVLVAQSDANRVFREGRVQKSESPTPQQKLSRPA